MNVKVTILIVTYNYEQYIGEAIESVINQDYNLDDIELIIIDDGSVDNTKKIVESYYGRIQIKYKFQSNNGKASGTRVGINLATGKYLFNLDADDFLYSSCISEVVKYYETDHSLVQVSFLANKFDMVNNFYEKQLNSHNLVNTSVNGLDFLELVLFQNYNIGLGSTFSAKLSQLKKIYIPDSIDMYIDLYLFLMIAQFGNIMQLDSVLVVFRRHELCYTEGRRSFQNEFKRNLRYLNSAKALFFQIANTYQSNKIRNYYKNFYNIHLLSSYRTLNFSKIMTTFKILYYMLSSFPLYKNSFYFIRFYSKIVAKNYLK